MGLPPQRPFPQYGPPAGRIRLPPPSYNSFNSSPQPQVQAQSPIFAAQSTSTFTQESVLQQRLATNPQPTTKPTNGTPAPLQGPLGPINSMTAPAQQQASKPSPDPVIQMLATKAATDHNLKALMRVVASGKASQAELRVFQGHIDELNGILQARNHANRPLAPNPSTASPIHGEHHPLILFCASRPADPHCRKPEWFDVLLRLLPSRQSLRPSTTLEPPPPSVPRDYHP
jgi:hypothetical protein